MTLTVPASLPEAWTQLSTAFKSDRRFISLKAPTKEHVLILFVGGDAFCICHLFSHCRRADRVSELSTI